MFTWEGIWAEFEVRWLSEAADLTWNINHHDREEQSCQKWSKHFKVLNVILNARGLLHCWNIDLRFGLPPIQQIFSAARSNVPLAAGRLRCSSRPEQFEYEVMSTAIKINEHKFYDQCVKLTSPLLLIWEVPGWSLLFFREVGVCIG